MRTPLSDVLLVLVLVLLVLILLGVGVTPGRVW
jgi:hypothetical protein